MQPHRLAERIDQQLDAGQWDAAAHRLTDVLAMTAADSPWQVGWLARLGRCALAAGQWAEARRFVKRAETTLDDIIAATDETSANARNDAFACLSAVMNDLGQMDAAERILRRWIAETTGATSAEPLRRLGELIADRGDRRTAIETLQAALVQADDDDLADQARLSLAMVLEEAGRRVEARRQRERALRNLARRCGLDDPDYLLGLCGQAVSLLDTNRPRRAVPILRRAVRLAAGWERTDPNLLATLCRNLAEALWECDAPPYRWCPHRDAALRFTARAMGPDSGEYLQARCWAAALEPAAQALPLLQTVLADSTQIASLPAHLRAEILAVIAIRLHELGRHTEAIDHFHQALALLPLDDREGMPPDAYIVATNTILGLQGILCDRIPHDRTNLAQAKHWLAKARQLAGDDVRFLTEIARETDLLAELAVDTDYA